VAQVGFYGAHFWSLAHTPHGKGYPAHFPVQGLPECRKWFATLNHELHAREVKVVGHFNVKFLVGDPEGAEAPSGFFKFYRDLWDERLLGPKPVADPRELLELNAAGEPIVNNNYSIGGMKEYWACLNNPHWRQVLKAWTKAGIENGVDGFIANYFYRHDCHCRHCVSGFKEHLASRYSPDELREHFQIDDLGAHAFPEIVAWHDPQQSTPLRREMLRWSQIANKRAFDDVFIDYGRSLKPDLIVAQWNHLGYFNQINGDERCLLPAEQWGRGEDYLWYSTGAAACFTDLAQGVLGEGTLQARYIRGTFEDKPFTLGKYEGTRIRTAIAELAANGGAPMGFYTRFTDPEARREIVRYYQFLKRYEHVYRGNHSHAEVLLLYPRSQVHEGSVQAVEEFKRLGEQLLNAHVLFDVLPDDLPVPPDRYERVIRVGDASPLESLPADRSRFEAPSTVRVSASRPENGKELTIHLVNYNRHEPETPRSPGRGIQDERPIKVDKVGIDFRLPPQTSVARVAFLTPESPEAQPLAFEQSAGRLRCQTPGLLVYGIVQVEFAP
jgi:hypothetical protein